MGEDRIISSAHVPVLLDETVQALGVQPGGRYVDCTIGGGGHAAAILENSQPGGQLLGMDADPAAAKSARKRLAAYGNSVLILNASYSTLEANCIKHNFLPVHGVVFDLGLSSLQLEDAGRGFSFQKDAPLDMRFDTEQELTAADIVNKYPPAELARIITGYGEESFGYRIARRIVHERPIKTTLELARLIEEVVPGRGKIHPATRTFQALRIAVNRELENLEAGLRQAVNVLGFEGRLVVISYHSLEDRLVKQFMKQESSACICPPATPVCICGHKPRIRLVNKKIITPSAEEMKANPRSRSARMRVAERVISREEWCDTAERLTALGETGLKGPRKALPREDINRMMSFN